MKIISLSSENVKRLKAVHITPDPDNGNLVIIGGDNGNGKSSVLDSIEMALGGVAAAAEMPVRVGEEKAVIVADLGEIIVKRTFTAAGGTSLVVTNKDGLKYPSPQSLLDGLLGKLSFDPLAFLRIDGKAQVETLRRLVGLDFRQLDADRKRVYDQRTIINAQVKAAEARVSAMPVHEVGEVPSLDELNRKLSDASAHNQSITVKEAEVAALEKKMTEANDYVGRCNAKIEDLKRQLDEVQVKMTEAITVRSELTVRHTSANQALLAMKPISTEEVITQIQAAQVTQRKINENQVRQKAVDEAVDLKKQSDALTKQLAVFDNEKASQLASASFPVPSLSFTEDGILLNGIPLSQASSAEQTRVSVAIGAALNPKVRVILVREGSLLDETNLGLLGKLAQEQNLQVWVERVSKGAECSVIMEDGAVQAPAAA